MILFLKKIIFILLLLTGICSAAELKWKWVYVQCNLSVPEDVTRVSKIVTNAASAGYNGVVLTDSKFTQPKYLKNRSYLAAIRRIKNLADGLEIEIIPRIFNLGYARGLLRDDVSLAEAMSVKEVLLKVSNGKAAIANKQNLLEGCRIDADRNKIIGWDLYDGFGKTLHIDHDVFFSSGASYRFDNFDKGRYFRLIKKINIEPYKQYRISVFIKTQGVSNPRFILALVMPDGRSGIHLSLATFEIDATQDWKKHSVVFNSKEFNEVYFYIGNWGAKTGTFWVDKVEVNECLGVNLVRRDGCPVKLTDVSGDIEYKEGVDYNYWEFKQLGKLRWPGTYHRDHLDVPLVIKTGSQIKEGQHLKVSYYAAPVVDAGQVGICLSHPKTYKILEEHIQRVNKLFSPQKVFIGCDEMRTIGQCGLCRSRNQTSGQIVADTIKKCKTIIMDKIPGAEIFIWSDMFDPYHNSKENYYFCAGSLEGSWQGIDPEFRVVNWNYIKPKQSLRFFNQRGNRQIIAWYYDKSDWKQTFERWLNAAQALDGPKIEGLMYCTWSDDFSKLEEFLDEARKNKAFR